MAVEIVEVADGERLELGEHVLPVDVRVIQLHKQLARPLLNAVVGLRYLEEFPIFSRDLNPGRGPLQVHLQGGRGKVFGNCLHNKASGVRYDL